MAEKIMRRSFTGSPREMRIQAETPKLTGNVSYMLANLRSRNETESKPADIYDLMSLFKAERDDHKIKSTTRRQTATPWDAKLNAVSHLLAKEPIDEKAKAEIELYLSEHIASSGAQATNETLQESDRTRAESNRKVYAQLRNAFYAAANPPETIPGADNPMTKEASEALMKDILPSAEEFAQYDISLDQTNTVLEKMGRPEKFTFAQMTKFLNALKIDVQKEQEKYDTNPKWKAKKEIVQSAHSFYQDHEKDDERGLIYVTAASDGSIRHVGWLTAADAATDTQEYVFDPDGEIDDKKSLSYHLYNLDQFKIILEKALPGAQNALKNAKVKTKVDPQEVNYLRILLERYAGLELGEKGKPSSVINED